MREEYDFSGGMKNPYSLITVKEYADSHGVTIQAVYQQMNRKKNKKFIEEHTRKIDGKKYLDQEAVKYLESQRSSSPAVVVQAGDKERLEQLENENKRLLLKVAELQDELLREKDQVKLLQEEKIILLEQKDKPKTSFWSKLFG